MAMLIHDDSATAVGLIRRIAAAAASAFQAPPGVLTQSSNWNRDWRTGLLNATRPLSTKCKSDTPHASRVRATSQPKVPAPGQQ